MSEFYKDYEITDDEANAVKISNVADRPNAFNSYRESKMSAADVKKIFDAPFLLVRRKFNEFLRKVASDKAASDEKVNEVYEAYKNGELKGDSGDDYVITEDDMQEIADLVLSNFVDGDEVSY